MHAVTGTSSLCCRERRPEGGQGRQEMRLNTLQVRPKQDIFVPGFECEFVSAG